MTFVNLTDDLCDAGAFERGVSPETARRAGWIDATQPVEPRRNPLDGLPDAMAHMLNALDACRDYLDSTPGDDAEARLIAHKIDTALTKYEAWRAQL